VWRYYASAGLPEYITGQSGLLFLNYTSGKASAGIGAHNKTVEFFVHGAPQPSAQHVVTAAFAPTVPETAYFVNAVGFKLAALDAGNSVGALSMRTERLAGEGPGSGWEGLMVRVALRDMGGYLGQSLSFIDASSKFRRGSWDADSARLALTGSRRYQINERSSSITPMHPFLYFLLTYHSVTKTVSGTVTDGAAVAQVGATVSLHRSDTGEKVGSATTNGSGVYTITWFDDTIEVFTETRINGTLIGRSDNGYAS
jgi:hypothetical protein